MAYYPTVRTKSFVILKDHLERKENNKNMNTFFTVVAGATGTVVVAGAATNGEALS